MEHVYGRREIFPIFLRKIRYLFFRVASKTIYSFKKIFSWNRKDENEENALVVFPAFENASQQFSVMNKLAWAFPEKSGTKIFYSSAFKEKKQDEIELADLQENYFDNNSMLYQIEFEDLLKKIKGAKRILVHDKDYIFSRHTIPILEKVKTIDPEYYSLVEGNFLKFGLYDTMKADVKDEFKNRSRENYQKLIERKGVVQESFIFVTGPSFDRYTEFEYPDNSLKIVCNTIVKNEEFMEYIGGPDIITFADPVFHFSSCNYAAEFRKLALNAAKKFDSFIAVPAATVPLLCYNYPDLEDRIIGFSNSKEMIFPAHDALKVKPTGSIITFTMIPLASSLSDKVYIIGADGRSPKENYFWKHNSKVQLDELMESVFKTHPSFFRDRVYSDHYEEHCKYFEKLLGFGESKGVNYISLTNSFIPALSKRSSKIKE